MNFNAIRVVLVATSHPGNIGATARAMKTMGFTNLYLVSPKIFPDKNAFVMAAGACDLLNSAKVTSFDEALKDCQLVFATSARERWISLPELTPCDAAKLISKQADSTQIAIVFGREHAGLTNDELLRSNYQIIIPANPDYSSLNLSQAVQIITYELRTKLLASSVQVANNNLATVEAVELFYKHLHQVMLEIGLVKLSRPTKALFQRLRRLFNRTQLERRELSILRGFLTKVQKYGKK